MRQRCRYRVRACVQHAAFLLNDNGVGSNVMEEDAFLDGLTEDAHKTGASMRGLLFGGLLLLLPGAASASETKTFTYDALGRLDTVSVSGGPGAGTNTDYNYDPANNRAHVTTTGAPSFAPAEQPAQRAAESTRAAAPAVGGVSSSSSEAQAQ